jgi:pimeloyl-ACP methyl ester carboxylesterase
MATKVLMPRWGMSMQEGRVTCWLKKEGDAVAQGEPVVEVESSKATNLVEAPASGVLARILVPEGTTVPITTAIAVIAAPGEGIPEAVDHSRGERSPPAERAGSSPEGGPADDRPGAEVPGPRSRERRRVAASPAARRLAREHDIDLSRLKGTGPEGMIVVEDVRGALQAPPRQGAVHPSRVVFPSQGHQLDGVLYLPQDYQAGQRLPGLVFCLGFTYVKELLVPEMARRLSARGWACLVFDYRGFGKSEGPRGRLFPLEQVADVQAAASFLAGRAEVDAGRIGLLGISLGGSHALYAAALDQRVRAVAAIAPVGEGRRWLRGLRRYWEWVELLGKVEADRAARGQGGNGARADAWEIVLPDPGSRAFLEGLYRDFPDLRCQLSLESAEALLDYSPEGVVGRLAGRPVLLVHGEADLLVPAEESRSLFARAGEPRQLVLVPGMGHFDWALPQDDRFDKVMDICIHWLADHLPVGGQNRDREASP